MSKAKTLSIVACLGSALIAYVFLNRRPDLTDPAAIAKLPPSELRDAEVECLVRAAFAGARSIHIQSEAAPSIDVSDPAICHGKPCVRGLRYPVEVLLELLSSGMTFDELLNDYPDLEREDLLAVLA